MTEKTRKEIDDGSGPSQPYAFQDESGNYQFANDDQVLTDRDPSDPRIGEDLTGDATAEGSSRAPVTRISQNNGQATIRTNRPMTFSGSIPIVGKISGSPPAGAVFTGRDSNGNGIPDILEREFPDSHVKFPSLP